MSSEPRACDVDTGGCRGHRHVSYDRDMHDDQWESVVEQGEAVGGLLRLDGGARLLDACFFSSRNIELLNGERFLHAVFAV